MNQLTILKHPHPILSTVCVDVDAIDAELITLSKNMTFTMIQLGGIGLAANQVGVPTRMFVMMIGGVSFTIINPKIIHQTLLQSNIQEGCLSIPSRSRIKQRYGSVVISYMTIGGQQKKITLFGVESVCAQHEIDHLNGKTMLD